MWCFLSSVSLCLGLERLAALSNPHTHTSAAAVHAGSSGAIVTASAWALASIACVEAYAFDFERLRVFEYVGEGPK